MKLAFIGGGIMAEAILKGVLNAGIAKPGDVQIGEPRPDRRDALSTEYGVETHESNAKAAAGADLVVLSVKPQDLPVVFAQLKPNLVPAQAALSIVAGAKMDTLTKGLDHSAIIRVMPNTPAQIGCGMTMWTCSQAVSQDLRELTKSVLGTVGEEIYVDDEKYLDMATAADLVVLSVKPQDLPVVFAQLKPNLVPAQAALSIVAGAKMDTLTKGLDHSAIIRVMPNTPAQIGCGMTMWTCSQAVSQDLRELTKSVLGTVGEEIYVDDEKYLDMATALSASGPAYVFLFIEALIDAGVYVGLPRDTARTLALQTVYGSTKLVMETGLHPGQLKDMVVSPGGTTAEGLQVLEKGGVPGIIVEAVEAAFRKSVRLGQG